MTQIKLILTLGGLVAFLALGGVALWYRSEAISAAAQAAQAKADLGTAVSANKAQEETIGRLRADAATNDRILAQMADDLAAINSNTAETNQAVGDLKEKDEDVRAYLGTAVPADLVRLLDK